MQMAHPQRKDCPKTWLPSSNSLAFQRLHSKDSLGGDFRSLQLRRMPSSTESLTQGNVPAWKQDRKHIHESPHYTHPICLLLMKNGQHTAMASGTESESALSPRIQTTSRRKCKTHPGESGVLAMGDASKPNVSEHFIVQTLHTPHTPEEVLNTNAETPANGWVYNRKPEGGEGHTDPQ